MRISIDKEKFINSVSIVGKAISNKHNLKTR